MPSSVPLSISVTCLPMEHLLARLLGVIDYQYIVTLNSRLASVALRALGRRSEAVANMFGIASR